MTLLVAFGSVPKDGGTFTFYRNIRPSLFEYGIDIRCVSVGKQQAQLSEPSYVDDGCVFLATDTYDLKKQSLSFAEWCERNSVNIVIGVNSEPILSSFPHLSEDIRCVSRCANAFDHGYRITMSGRDRLAAIIALTPRLRDDLIRHYGADSSLLHLIPNGIDPTAWNQAANAPRGESPFVRLGFLGRLEHNQKGVLHLPHIVKALNKVNVPFILKIAGKGKHRQLLEKQMEKVANVGQVEFLGSLPPSHIPDFLASTDIFLFTSHFEGCPNALLEAMMAGCVPVSWLIEGITDYIIDDGKTGFLLKTGDYTGVAAAIAMLSKERLNIPAMSDQVAMVARKRFSHTETALRYAEIFHHVMKQPPPPWKPRDWSDFKGDENFKHSSIEIMFPSVYHKLRRLLKGV